MSPLAAPHVTRGSRFRSFDIQLNSIPFTSGGVERRRLPNSYPIKQIILRLSGTFTVTGAGTNVGNERPLELIQRIEIEADGSRKLVSMPGRDAFRWGHVLLGKQPELVGTDATSVTVQPFSALIVLNQEALRMARPIDSYFNPRPFQNVELAITWGTLANLATGGTIALSAVTCDVTVRSTVEGIGLSAFDKIYITEVESISATSGSLLHDVPKAGLLSRILLRTSRDGATVDNIVNKVNLLSDFNAFHKTKLIWAMQQRQNVLDYQLDGAAVVGNQIPGNLILDTTEDGFISSCLNTYDVNKTQLDFDVTRTSGTELIVITYEYFQPLPDEVIRAGLILPAA